MSTTNHPLDGERKWGIISFYLLPYLQIYLLPYIQKKFPPNTWLYLNTAWVRFVRLAQLTTSNSVLNLFTSLPLLLASWIDGLILLYAQYNSGQSIMLRVFLGCLIFLVMIDVNSSVIQCFSNNYCCNWYMYKFVKWLKKSVVDKRIRPWTISNFVMNFSIVLLAISSVRFLFWYGALSISLVATICVVFGKKDDMGVMDGLATCYYMCTLTLFTTHDHGVLVSLVSLAVLLFLFLCTVGLAPNPNLKTSQDDSERRLEEGHYGKEGDENGDVSLQQEVSELKKELHDHKEYVKSIKQCHCQEPKSSEYNKPEPTLVVGKSGAYIIRGFGNFARNCFFNAVIQVLLCIPHLRVPFMKLNDYDGSLTRSIKELFIETSLSPVSDSDKRLRSLYEIFCAESPQFRDGQDQDSHEFVVSLLQRLEDEEENVAPMFPNSRPRLVESIFGGQFLNTTSCLMRNCRYTTEGKEPFLQILLPIPVTGDLSRASRDGNKGAAVSLTTCLDQYIEVEFVPDRRCDRCCCTGVNTSIRVMHAPSILTISLMRFNADNKKINDHIIFEETFDLRAYMDDRSVGSDKLEYHLIGVVVHVGSVDTGHCFAYVRGDKSGGSKEDNEDFTWYRLDDLVVREVSLGEVLQSQAYMLFYEKRDSSVKQGLSYAKTSSAFGPPATPSGYGNSSETVLDNFRVASIRQNETTHRSYSNRTSASQIPTPISNHGSSKHRHRRSKSITYGSSKQVSSERPWKSPDESMYVSWRNSSLEDFKGNGGGRWRSDD